MPRQTVNMAGVFCLLCTVGFKFLISTLTPQGHDIINFKDETEYLTENQRKKTVTKHRQSIYNLPRRIKERLTSRPG
jgi:hypothetical protein